MIRLIMVLVCLFLVAFGDNVDLKNGEEVTAKLSALREQPKYLKDMKSLYFGAPDEATRVRAESIINNLLDVLIQGAAERHKKEFLWSKFESAARKLKKMDSEEMDRGLVYMEEIMDIYSIESSGGRLNDWRYGFGPSDPALTK